ncbi:MAG: MFS transporter [Pseudomonadota bacterium]
MDTIKKYFLLETSYAFALSFTKATFVLFFLDKGLSYLDVALIFSVFNLTVIIAEPLTAFVADAFGRRPSLIIGAFLKVIAAILFITGKNIPQFICAEIISGIAATFISGCLMAWMVDNLQEKDRHNLCHLFARCEKYKYLALIAGGLLGALSGEISLKLPWFFCALFFTVFLLVVLQVMPADSGKGKMRKKMLLSQSLSNYRLVTQDAPLLLLIISSFMATFAMAPIQLFWLPSIKHSMSASISFLGFLWVGIASCNFLGASLIPRYLRFFKNKIDGLALSMFISFFFLILMILTIHHPLTILFYFLFELGSPLFSSVRDDLINQQIKGEERVTILSLQSLMAKLGTCSGLFLFGQMGPKIGQQNSWYFFALFFLGNIFVYWMIQFLMMKTPIKRKVLSLDGLE